MLKQKIRMKDGGEIEVNLSRTRAIKAMCTECMGYGEGHPKECTDKLCPLYSFRGKINLAYGKNEQIENDENDDEETD